MGSDVRDVLSRAVTSLERAGESEVDNLDVVVRVEKDVLRLQIAMSQAHGVQIVDGQEHLLEVVLADVFGESSGVRDIVEELTTWDHLLSDVCNLNSHAAGLVHSGALAKGMVLDDVLVVELFSGLNFFSKKLE